MNSKPAIRKSPLSYNLSELIDKNTCFGCSRFIFFIYVFLIMSRPYKRFRKFPKKNSPIKRPRVIEENADSNDDNGEEVRPQENEESLNVYTIIKPTNSRYYGSKLYFNEEEFNKNPLLFIKIEAAINFMKRNPDISRILPAEKAAPSFHINVDRFYGDDEFLNEWDTFKSDLHDMPRETLNCLGIALHQRIVKAIHENTNHISLRIENLPMMRVKIFNCRPLIPTSEIKSISYGKLIATRGCIIRVGRTKELAQWILFACKKCGHQAIIKQPEGIYTVPKKCDLCGPTKFDPKLDSPYVKTVPLQVIKLQEHLDAIKDDRGKMPRIIEVELIDDLVGTCVPGDDVTVVGIVKARGTDDGISKKKDATSPNALYIEAVSIINNKNKSQIKTAGLEVEEKDFPTIQEIQSKHDLFPLLVRSLCPAIYGHEMIKAGLLLSLFGGRAKQQVSRDDIHVLMVGDPGLGKSQMLQACARIASQGIYVCGSSSTSSGLTVTLAKEAGTNDFALEPGALVLADRGCCLIDEFDKMPTQHQALLEAMEQQSVSVAKSGVVCSLQARTSILAAANPTEGRYNPSKTVMNNINLSQPLLSRFDLVFLLLDQPTIQSDALLCMHLMNAHKGFKQVMRMNNSNPTPVSNRFTTLRERLTAFNDENEILPQMTLRKYVAYARQWVEPKLTQAAAKVLQKFYLELRKENNIFGSLPVFHRQLEALIRLTEARAKLELRVMATEKDAEEIIELYKFTLASVPKVGVRATVKNDTGKMTANKVRAFIKILSKASERNSFFSRTELEELAEDGGIAVDDFSRFIGKLNEEGVLIKRGKDMYQFIQD